MIFTDKDGHKRKGKQYSCLKCGKEFVERLVPAQKTLPKYCSQTCSQLARRKRIIVVCDNCGEDFERVINKLKNSKHGKNFCSRDCKDNAQSFRGDCSEIHPPHYDMDNPSDYRRIAYDSLPNCCSDCGETTRWMLVVHHIDGNRKNNLVSNLEIVCCNHHTARHLRLSKRGWVYDPSVLTPRNKLVALVSELAQERGLNPRARKGNLGSTPSVGIVLVSV